MAISVIPTGTLTLTSFGKRARLDYALASPELMNRITDHSTLMLKIDFNKAEGGKGVFRCLPALHKDVDYQRLIRNAIKLILLSNVIPNAITKLEIANVTTRIAMEEEIKALEETTLDWQTNDRLIALRYTVATLLSNEPTN